MDKKNTKKNKKMKVINNEPGSLLLIFIGIFMLYALNSESMGIIGNAIQVVTKGLFGSMAISIPFIFIIGGVLFFFENNNEIISKIRNNNAYTFIIVYIFLIYGMLNINNLPVESPLSMEMIFPVIDMGINGEGAGIIITTITYYIKAMFGVTGSWLIIISTFIIGMLVIFKWSVKDILLNMKAKSKGIKNGNITFGSVVNNAKDKLVSTMTEEVEVGDKRKSKKKNETKNEDNYEDDVDDKTIKIVGFNKAEDDYLEILETTSTNMEPIREDLIEDVKERPIKTSKTYDDKKDDGIINISNNQNYKNYKKPPTSLLSKNTSTQEGYSRVEVEKNAQRLKQTLSDFGVDAKVDQVTVGPTITRYEIQPSPGVKVSKIVNLTDDIALSLAAKSIRMEAPIPGKSAIGIEVPNEKSLMVGVREVLESNEFKNFNSPLAMALGKDISGNPIIGDIAKMPHLLIAGSTGSGKSVCVNTLISSIIYKSKPDEVKLLLIDPKVVELASYNGIPHLLIPVVTDPKKAANALNWAVVEMNKRYKLFAENSVKDITSYNEKASEKLPKIVIIIDELADLMMVSANDVEDYICRLAQMARAAGMHLIVATQRPSVDVITGVIKANIPSRIAFAVSSQTDSRTILDMGGAEKLLGKGDMLFYPLGAAKPVRIQGAFISEEESERVINFVKEQSKEEVKYEQDILETISKVSMSKDSDEDEILNQAIEFVVESGQASASMLQRKFKVGFNRAARLIDSMEERGIVGQNEGSKPRKVLISKKDLEQLEGE